MKYGLAPVPFESVDTQDSLGLLALATFPMLKLDTSIPQRSQASKALKRQFCSFTGTCYMGIAAWCSR